MSRLLRVTAASQSSVVRAALRLASETDRSEVLAALEAARAPEGSLRSTGLALRFGMPAEEYAAADELRAGLSLSMSALVRAALVLAEDADPDLLARTVEGLPGTYKPRKARLMAA